jgi:hypothetical protein
MATVVSLFERLGRPQQTKKQSNSGALNPHGIKKAIDHAIKKVIEKHGADRETFLMDILANGPVPATVVEARGAAHGITRKQLRKARSKMRIMTFKETGKIHGCWLWALPQHDPAAAAAPDT